MPDELLAGIMTVKEVHFFSLQNGYAIVRGITEKTKRTGGVTFKGVFQEYPEVGQVFCVKGVMEADPKRRDAEGKPEKYFKISHCHPQENRTEQGWIEYLIRECPRVSEIRATELVNALGVAVIEKLAESTTNITSVQSTIMKLPIRQEEANQIHEWAKAELRLSKMKAWLYEKGLTYSLVARILRKYGPSAPTIVRNTPFLLTEIDGIGFLTADKIARAVKVPPDSPMRIRAAILYQMEKSMEDGGHTCITRHKLIEEVCILLSLHHAKISECIDELLSSGKLCNNDSPIEQHTRFPFLFDDSTPPLLEGIEP